MERELKVAVEAARKAALAIKAIYDRPDIEVRQKEGDKGPLTEADLASERVLLQTIREAFPDDGILSEESKDDGTRLAKKRVWIIDPLDGTREFTMRIPEFCVSIGLAVDGEAALGVLCNPVTGELIAGVVGQGAMVDGKPTRTTAQATVEGARFLVSRNEEGKGGFDRWKAVAKLEPMGSVAWKLGLVAAGRADATFTPKPRNEWDLAGGVACVLAAGGRATNGAGVAYRFNNPDPLQQGVCVTNGPLHGAVLEMMR